MANDNNESLNRVRKLLKKQMELLAEESKESMELVQISMAMVEIAKVYKDYL